MQKTNWLQVVRSVFASMIGVQSDKNRQQDFAGGNPGAFIVIGIVAVFLFIGVLILIVSLVV
ncbi:MAG: DUF2970 domain-containing protein [Gammaproteobacteria bacterium]